ncbi:MAG TPA: helix-turn-helix domain-containing protein [Gemmatimonadaceae bacterium]|nr:helix-turn-helix domain-containing protein [Gemmatimonadaceae bacterium]
MITLDQGGRGRATTRIIPAPPSIGAIAELLWIDSTRHDVGATHHWTVVADDAPHLIYSLLNDGRGDRHRLVVVGARRVHARIHLGGRQLTVGVRLRPGSLPALFGVDASSLTDRATPFDSMVPPAERGAAERFHGRSPEQIAHELARVIARLAGHGRPLDHRARLLETLARQQSGDVRAIATQFRMSDRGLRAWSSAHVGIGVRRILRIRRVHAALEIRLAQPRSTWSTIAARTGFADHSHLVRDCTALVGESPSAFLARG